MWCYVDAETCGDVEDLGESTYFSDPAGDALVYSYETCGNSFPSEDDDEEADAEDDADAEGEDVEEDVEEDPCACKSTNYQTIHIDSDGNYIFNSEQDGETYAYPGNYGVGTCAANDAGLEPFCADNEEAYCELEWCYVDAACDADDVTESTFVNDTEGNPLSFSYMVCGNELPESDEDSEDADEEDADEADADEEDADEEDADEEDADEEDLCACLSSDFETIVGE